MGAGIEVGGTSAGTAGPGQIIDPTGEGGGAAEEMAALTAHRAQEDAVLAVSGGVIEADVGTPAEAIAPGTEVKVESDAEVEEYHGAYVCLICFESVRGQPALNCSECDCPLWHIACDKDKKYVDNCPQCGAIGSVQAFTGANFWSAAPSAMIDLTGEGGGAAAVAALTARGAREEDAAPDVGGGVVAADVGGGGGHGGQADEGSGSSGKGKEPAWAEAGPEAGGDGAATSAGAGTVVGIGKGKGRVDNGQARGGKGRSCGERSGGGGGGGRSGHLGGAGSSRAAEGQSEEGSRKRAAPDGDEGGSSGGGKRARGGKPGQCEHNRRRSRCKECGGAGICQHARIRSRCKTCKADKDESMPPDLEEL